jgi:hypothetical protein
MNWSSRTPSAKKLVQCGRAWQGGLRHASPDVVRRGKIMRAHVRQAVDQTTTNRPARDVATGRLANRP